MLLKISFLLPHLSNLNSAYFKHQTVIKDFYSQNRNAASIPK